MVDRKIQDKGSFLAGADVDALIGEAVKQYSRFHPRVVTEDESGDGGFDYQVGGTGGARWPASRLPMSCNSQGIKRGSVHIKSVC